MRRLILIGVLVWLAAVPVIAQETPRAEVFAGYSVVPTTATSLHGWAASLNGNINTWFGIKGDFSGHYKTFAGAEVKLHTFTFGPQISYRKNKNVVVFAHALFGGAHASAGFDGLSVSNTSFAANLGAGLDWVPHKNVAIRAIQADVLITRFGTTINGDARISVGVVFRFGSK